VIASVDTCLRFAEAVNRLDLTQTEAAGLRELRGGAVKESVLEPLSHSPWVSCVSATVTVQAWDGFLTRRRAIREREAWEEAASEDTPHRDIGVAGERRWRQ
jgi:hypothetical protein